VAEKTQKQIPQILSRRSFARGAALAVGAVAMLPADLLAQTQASSPSAPDAKKSEEHAPKLSPADQAEAEAKIQNILRKYGSRLGDEERADVRKLVFSLQESLGKLRGFPLGNSDEPALVLRAVVKEKE